MVDVKRGFVTVGDRQVHYRYAGEGPPVILIHQSPTSSKTLDLQTRTFAARFRAIAIDIPGMGLSDAIPNCAPTMADLAIGLAATLDALGIERAALYGSHTGASICVEFARLFPERAVKVLIDGYPIYTEGEMARRVSTYLQDYTESWDGSHLLWLWYRYREQYLYWPWNAPGRGTRANCDVPDADFLHSGVVDLLGAGNGYQRPYLAAFRYAAEAAIGEVTVPVVFLAYADDSLTVAHDLLPTLPPNCTIEAMPFDRTEGAQKELELFLESGNYADAPQIPLTSPLAAGPTRSYVDAGEHQLATREMGRGGPRPLVMLPPAPGSGTRFLPLLKELSKTRRVIAIDLPNCGDSDDFGSDALSIEAIAAIVGRALERLGLVECDLYGLNGGALAALELATTHPGIVGTLILDGLPYLEPRVRPDLADHYSPAIDVNWDGTHWLTMWHAVRNEQLFWPWYDQTAQATRNIEPHLDPAALTEMVHSYMKHPARYADTYRAVFAYDAEKKLSELKTVPFLCAQEYDVFFEPARRAASDLGAAFATLTTSINENVQTLNSFLPG